MKACQLKYDKPIYEVVLYVKYWTLQFKFDSIKVFEK